MKTTIILVTFTVFLISGITTQSHGVGSSELIDGCFYTNGALFGCLKTTVLGCDSSWMFQLVAPLESDPHASYVFAEGFVNGYGSQFYQCYDSQDREQCSFCLAFTNSQVEGGEMSAFSQIYVTCPGAETVMFDFGQITNSGFAECGTEGYFYPPCNSFDNYYYTSTHSTPSVLENALTHYFNAGHNSWSELLFMGESCVYLLPLGCNDFQTCGLPWIELYCPDVIMDTCSENSARLRSHGGLLIQVNDISAASTCLPISGGNVCVLCETTFLDSISLSTMLEVQLVDGFGNLLDSSSTVLYETFPQCGYDSFSGCWDWTWSYVSISYVTSWKASPTSKHSPSSHHHKSPSSHGSPSSKHHSSNSSDDGANVAAISASVTVVTVLFIVISLVVGLFIFYRLKVRARTGSSEDVYSMMLQ